MLHFPARSETKIAPSRTGRRPIESQTTIRDNPDMKKSLWRRAFAATSIPKYPCPRCEDGHLAPHGEVMARQPAWSCRRQEHDYADIEDIVERFHIWMVCQNDQCGEMVSVIGTARPEPDYDDQGEMNYVSALRPEAIFPTPSMIHVPTSMPQQALDHLKKAFQVCWSDTNAAANCLRVSVEHLLDELGIPRTRKNEKGEEVHLDLNSRIHVVENSSGKLSGHAKTLHALRIVGNLGSHGEGVKWDHLLDGYFIYEKALSDLLGNENSLFEEARGRLLGLKKSKRKKAILLSEQQ